MDADPLVPGYDTFAGRVGQPFTFRLVPDRSVDLELLEVRGQPPVPGAAHTFAVVLGGPADTFLEQATYSVRHREIGTFDLFIVPVGTDGRTVRYEAVFTRLATP